MIRPAVGGERIPGRRFLERRRRPTDFLVPADTHLYRTRCRPHTLTAEGTPVAQRTTARGASTRTYFGEDVNADRWKPRRTSTTGPSHPRRSCVLTDPLRPRPPREAALTMRTPDADGRPRQETPMTVALGPDFDRGVLAAAGVDPDQAQLGTVQIDALPPTGDVTIRYTAIATAPAAAVRNLICKTADTSVS